MNEVHAFLLTSIAGFSTVIGSAFIFFKSKNPKQTLTKALAFAAGVMITVSLFDLIIESQNLLLKYFVPIKTICIHSIFIFLGFSLSRILDHYMPESKTIDSKLYRVGMISMIAIILHNIPEGIATFITSTHNASLGIALALAISLHNIPEGISISIPIYYASKSRKKAFAYTFISGISELLGAILAATILYPFITETVMGALYAIIAGIMLEISFYELLPTSLHYQNPKTTIFYFLVGVGVMLFSHFCI